MCIQLFFVCTFQLFYQVLTQKHVVGSHSADCIRVSICQVLAEYHALSGWQATLCNSHSQNKKVKAVYNR